MSFEERVAEAAVGPNEFGPVKAYQAIDLRAIAEPISESRWLMVDVVNSRKQVILISPDDDVVALFGYRAVDGGERLRAREKALGWAEQYDLPAPNQAERREREPARELAEQIARAAADTTPKPDAETARAIERRAELHESACEEAKRPTLDALPKDAGTTETLAELRKRDVDVVTPESAQKWAEVDARDFRKMQELGRQEDAAVAMAEVARTNAAYRAALAEKAPDVAKHVQTLEAVNKTKVEAKDERKHVGFAIVDEEKRKVYGQQQRTVWTAWDTTLSRPGADVVDQFDPTWSRKDVETELARRGYVVETRDGYMQRRQVDAAVTTDSVMAAKEDRKRPQFEAMERDKIERAMQMTPEVAASKAKSDATAYRDEQDQSEKYYAGSDMAMAAKYNKAYRESLEQVAPDVAKVVTETARKAEAANESIGPLREAANEKSAPLATGTIDAAALERVAANRARAGQRDVGGARAPTSPWIGWSEEILMPTRNLEDLRPADKVSDATAPVPGEHVISYAYPSSPNAARLKHGKTGCYILKTVEDEQPYRTYAGAKAAAEPLGTMPQRWSMDHSFNERFLAEDDAAGGVASCEVVQEVEEDATATSAMRPRPGY